MTGLAVLARDGARPEVRWSGAFKTPSGLEEASRLRRVHEAVRVPVAVSMRVRAHDAIAFT